MPQKMCRKCEQPFFVEEDDLRFYDMISPVFAGKKHLIPPPTFCPECRQQRRLTLINERFLYPSECGLCHKRILSQFPPHLRQPNFCDTCWHSDKWDPRDYGRDFDFSRPFFEQLQELKRSSPAPALDVQGTNINSEYIHCAGSCKNCYLIMHADYCEDCSYGYGFKKNRSCFDGFYNLHCELCYDCVDVYKCYGLKSSQDCISCSSSAFLRDCIGCQNCFLCVGLRNREYCFENQQLTKEEWKRRMAEIDLGSHATYQACAKRLKELEKSHPFKEFMGYNTENSLGNYLKNCKNARFCFDCENVEDGKFCYQLVLGAKNCWDINQYGTNLQQSYECCIVGENTYHVLFCIDANIDCSDLLYCWYIERSKNCFGCANAQGLQYCILNKQYSKEEYEKLVGRIIEHMGEREAGARLGFVGPQPNKVELKNNKEWGEFFPSSISPFGYNKTTAQLSYPLTKEEALSKRFAWDEYEPPPPQVSRIIPVSKLPDNIDDVRDDILEAAVFCEATGKLFRITPAELRFYRSQRIPFPRRHPDRRHLDRFEKRNPRKLWTRSCAKCGKNIQTTFPPDNSEIVYCEFCYQKTVY